MNTLSVSIVIPALNEESYISRCLVSVLEQDYPRDRLEVVVVDNGSVDATASIARRFPVRVIEEPRAGVAGARNAGIRAARGEIVAFIDADCIAKPAWLRELLSGSDDKTIGCFAGDILPVPDGGLISDYIHDRRLISQEALLSSTPPVAAGANIAYRKSVFEEIGCFDEKFTEGEDGDLFWRFMKSNRLQYRFQRPAVVLHHHPSSAAVLLRRAFRAGRGIARFRLKHRDDMPENMSSLSRYTIVFIFTLGGCMIYPLKVWREKKRGRSLARSFAYAFLDKAYSISLIAGMLGEFIQARRRNEDQS